MVAEEEVNDLFTTEDEKGGGGGGGGGSIGITFGFALFKLLLLVKLEGMLGVLPKSMVLVSRE